MICYLCGNEIKANITKDHIPPKQFFPEEIRKNYDLQLITLPTHKECNQAYQQDEDYFYATIGPVALSNGNPIGDIIIKEIANRKYGPNTQLLLNIFKGFNNKVGNIYIPGCISLKVKGERINRVVWKIIRGLYYFHNNSFLPENINHGIVLLTPEALQFDNKSKKLWEEWNFVLRQPSQAKHQMIFDYKYIAASEAKRELWALLLWDRIIVFVYFYY